MTALPSPIRIVAASAYAAGRTKIQTAGPVPYVLVWMTLPVFTLLIVGLIYRHDRELRDYAIVGGACLALLFGMLFSAGEILDDERQRGTLGNLFLAPCSRYAWLGGFQLFAVLESLATAALTFTTGAVVFGLTVDIAPLTLLVTLVFFICCMWGVSMMVGAIGVAIRNANQLSNLLFVPILMVGGTMYPIALMPDWLRIPARFLPFGYGIQALVDATTKGASAADLWRELVPLAGFAVVLPLLGVTAFRQVERLARRRGALDLT
ncbi:ABC transporter permease [Actinopolymorpha sp. B11F2]|uniref:ABC transporter permease n=1 Tax=Actinopolymorpha sp. B11F2 TaxID=3160862 RepID=UPI0032E381DB